MTRAKDELVLTSAADYGTARTRKVSRFVVEALDLPSPAPRRGAPRRSRRWRAQAPAPEPAAAASRRAIPRTSCCGSPTARSTTTRPARSSTATSTCCACRCSRTTRVVYGNAVHKAVRSHFEARLAGRASDADALVAAFREAWVSEGFLSREHEEQRLRAGEAMLRRFHAEEAARALAPDRRRAGVRLLRSSATSVQGRYDLVLERDGRDDDPRLQDRRRATTRRRAERRARESLQLDVYALAQLRDARAAARLGRAALPGDGPRRRQAAHAAGGDPDRGPDPRRGEHHPGASSGAPSFFACSQCPFREICPHTAGARPRKTLDERCVGRHVGVMRSCSG